MNFDMILIMFLRTIQAFVALTFITSCVSDPTPTSKSACGDSCCLPSEEPPPALVQDVDAISVAAEECLSCLGVTATACLDEYENCVTSLSCRSWQQCNSECVIKNEDVVCYDVCDDNAQDFYTPEKLKSCSCEVCYAQCFNMCPPE